MTDDRPVPDSTRKRFCFRSFLSSCHQNHSSECKSRQTMMEEWPDCDTYSYSILLSHNFSVLRGVIIIILYPFCVLQFCSCNLPGCISDGSFCGFLNRGSAGSVTCARNSGMKLCEYKAFIELSFERFPPFCGGILSH